MQHRQKPERVELAARANAKLGQAIARAENSLVAECKAILDSTFGGPGATRYRGISAFCFVKSWLVPKGRIEGIFKYILQTTL